MEKIEEIKQSVNEFKLMYSADKITQKDVLFVEKMINRISNNLEKKKDELRYSYTPSSERVLEKINETLGDTHFGEML